MERAAHPAPRQKPPRAQRGRPHRFWKPRQTRSLGARGRDPKQHTERTHGLQLHGTDARESRGRARRAPAEGTPSSTRGPVGGEGRGRGRRDGAEAPGEDRTRALGTSGGRGTAVPAVLRFSAPMQGKFAFPEVF